MGARGGGETPQPRQKSTKKKAVSTLGDGNKLPPRVTRRVSRPQTETETTGHGQRATAAFAAKGRKPTGPPHGATPADPRQRPQPRATGDGPRRLLRPRAASRRGRRTGPQKRRRKQPQVAHTQCVYYPLGNGLLLGKRLFLH